MCHLTEFCSAGFTEEAEEAETDGTGVNRNKSEHSLLTFLSVASFFTVNVWQIEIALRLTDHVSRGGQEGTL